MTNKQVIDLLESINWPAEETEQGFVITGFSPLEEYRDHEGNPEVEIYVCPLGKSGKLKVVFKNLFIDYVEYFQTSEGERILAEVLVLTEFTLIQTGDVMNLASVLLEQNLRCEENGFVTCCCRAFKLLDYIYSSLDNDVTAHDSLSNEPCAVH